MRTSNKFIRRVSWRKQIRQWRMKWPGEIDSLHALKPVLADQLTRLTGVYYILTRLAFLGALEEAREPHFAKLVGLALEKCPWRIHASAQPTFSAIDLGLPLTRTKHQICVLDFGCCKEALCCTISVCLLLFLNRKTETAATINTGCIKY